MELKNYNVYFFLGILTFISGLTFLLFQPFFIAIALAAILATLFYGMYSFFLRITNNHGSLSALITTLILLLIIIIPLAIVITLVGGEILAAYQIFATGGDFYQKFVQPIALKIQASSLYHFLPLQKALSQESFSQYSAQIGQFVVGIVQNTYQGVANLFFLVFVMLFSLYYFLIDGKSIVQKIMYISPLKDAHEKLLVSKFVSISRATIKGVLVIGLIQGSIGAATFALVGIPSAITWGLVMMLFSIIPLFGSGIVWLPAALILLLGGHIWQGVAVLLVGFGIISTIDNFLRPKLIGKDTQMHPLMVFFATLGGISMFGFIGFIVGPIIVALFVSLWEIYGFEFKTQLKKYNE